MNKIPRSDDSIENDPVPNDDGFVLGTAGRDEDPNLTTDWQHPLKKDDATTATETRGLPGYPGAQVRETSGTSQDSQVNGHSETNATVENDGAD